MVRSRAETVEDYLSELPDERREVVSAVRDVIIENLPAGYQESMNRGMISYEIPLERYPDTYNGQPLAYIGLAAQKNHYALYLMGVYQDAELADWLQAEFEKSGKKYDMGKSCLRFRKLEDLPLDVIAEVVGRVTPDRLIAGYEASRRR